MRLSTKRSHCTHVCPGRPSRTHFFRTTSRKAYDGAFVFAMFLPSTPLLSKMPNDLEAPASLVLRPTPLSTPLLLPLPLLVFGLLTLLLPLTTTEDEYDRADEAPIIVAAAAVAAAAFDVRFGSAEFVVCEAASKAAAASAAALVAFEVNAVAGSVGSTVLRLELLEEPACGRRRPSVAVLRSSPLPLPPLLLLLLLWSLLLLLLSLSLQLLSPLPPLFFLFFLLLLLLLLRLRRLSSLESSLLLLIFAPLPSGRLLLLLLRLLLLMLLLLLSLR
mmetsp:Transcript_43691/g.74311  ORF Transcript_43691/g.74311 Transcript_43691/m.74311 type:complete len:275 (+) Transcript_43691:457-1281(+)